MNRVEGEDALELQVQSMRIITSLGWASDVKDTFGILFVRNKVPSLFMEMNKSTACFPPV